MSPIILTDWVLVFAVAGSLAAIAMSSRISGLLKFGLFIYVLLPTLHFVLYTAIGDVVNPLVLVSEPTYYAGMVRELGVTWAIITGFWLFATYWPRPAAVRARPSERTSRALFILYVIGVVVAVPLLLQTFAQFGGSYLAANSAAIETRREDLGAASVAGIVVSLVGSLSLATLIWDWGNRRRAALATAISLGFVTIWGLINTLIGSRVSLVMPLLAAGMIFSRVWKRSANKAMLAVTAGSVGLASLGLLAVIIPAIGVIRGNSFNASDVAEASQRNASFGARDVLYVFGWDYLTKYDPVSYSAMLLEEGAGSAGLRPILASLTAPIPRVLYPSKPVPGSVNQDYSGTPARIAAVRVGMSELAGNVPVSPAAVGLWELGVLGVALVIVLNWGALLFVNQLLSSRSVVPLTLGIMYIGFPSASYLLGSPDTVIKNVLQTLVLLALGQGAALLAGWWRSIPALRRSIAARRAAVAS